MEIISQSTNKKKPEGEPSHIIICDDDFRYGEMLSEYLRIACACQVTWVMSSTELWKEIDNHPFDVLFLDFQLPGASGLEILEKAMSSDLDLPTVMMTGQGNEAVAVKAMQLGALDYLVKGDFDFNILPRIIERAIHYRTLRREIRFSQNRNEYQATILNNVQDAVVVWDSNGNITYWNDSAEKIFGHPSISIIGKPAAEVYFSLFIPPIESPVPLVDNVLWSERRLRADKPVWVSSKITRFTTRDYNGVNNHYMDVTRDITIAKRERKALEQNQHMINRILEASPNIVFLFNLKQKRVSFIIPNQEQILTKAVERIFTQSSSPLIEIHPDDLPRIENNLANLPNIQTHKVTTIDFRIRPIEAKNWQWMLIREAVFHRNKAGEIDVIIGVCEDITEQKTIEIQLEQHLQSERFLSSLSNQLLRIDDSLGNNEILSEAVAGAANLINSCAGFILFMENNELVAWATSSRRQDYQENSLPVSISLSDNVYPWQIDVLTSTKMLIIRSVEDLSKMAREKINFLLSYMIKAVVIIPIAYREEVLGVLLFGLKEWDPSFENKHGYLLTTMRQIILKALIQSQSEINLRLSEARYRAIVDEHQTEMICRFTPDFKLTFANTAYCRYHAIERGKISNVEFLQFISENDLDEIRGQILGTIDNQETTHLTFQVHHQSDIKWQEWILHPVKNEDQVIVEYQAVGRDISDRKEMEDKINAAYARLAQTNRLLSIGQLAASMAHQINNPLTTIIADAQLLANEIPSDDPYWESISAIVSSGWRVQKIVDQLLKFSSSDETKQQVKIRQSIEEALLLSSSQVLDELSQIEVLVPNDLALEADLHQIEDLWLNLLLGIISKKQDYHLDDISISFTAEQIPEGLMIRLTCDNLVFSDNDATTFFDPGLVPTSSKWSTGMELSISREVVRQNNGSIKAIPFDKGGIIEILFHGKDHTA